MTSPDPDTFVRHPARLAALYATGLLDSDADELVDRLTRLAVRMLDVPTSFISLVDEHRASTCIDGEPVESFCVIDGRAHAWTERDVEILRELALSAQREIALRLSLRRAEEARNEAASANPERRLSRIRQP